MYRLIDEKKYEDEERELNSTKTKDDGDTTSKRNPTSLWHTKDERPEDDSQILVVDDGWGKAGKYMASSDYFAAAAGGIAGEWEDEDMDYWAYIKDLVPKKEKEDGV